MRWTNNRGQVPIVMLVVVALILVIVALVAFSSFDRSFENNPINNSKTVAMVQFGYDYTLGSAKLIAAEVIKESNGSGSDLRGNFTRVAAGFDRQISDPANNFFKRIREGAFSFDSKDDIYLLKVEELFVKTGYGNNEMTRNFGLCMLFDSKGNYLEKSFNATTEERYEMNCVSVL